MVKENITWTISSDFLFMTSKFNLYLPTFKNYVHVSKFNLPFRFRHYHLSAPTDIIEDLTMFFILLPKNLNMADLVKIRKETLEIAMIKLTEYQPNVIFDDLGRQTWQKCRDTLQEMYQNFQLIEQCSRMEITWKVKSVKANTVCKKTNSQFHIVEELNSSKRKLTFDQPADVANANIKNDELVPLDEGFLNKEIIKDDHADEKTVGIFDPQAWPAKLGEWYQDNRIKTQVKQLPDLVDDGRDDFKLPMLPVGQDRFPKVKSNVPLKLNGDQNSEAKKGSTNEDEYVTISEYSETDTEGERAVGLICPPTKQVNWKNDQEWNNYINRISGQQLPPVPHYEMKQVCITCNGGLFNLFICNSCIRNCHAGHESKKAAANKNTTCECSFYSCAKSETSNCDDSIAQKKFNSSGGKIYNKYSSGFDTSTPN